MITGLNDPNIARAYHEVMKSGLSVATELTRLATAQKINSAADDAVNLVLGHKLEAESRGLEQYNANALDEIGQIDTELGELESASEESIRASENAIREGDTAALADIEADHNATLERHAALSAERASLSRQVEFQSDRRIRLQASQSRLVDADMIQTSVDLASESIKQHAGLLSLAHSQNHLSSFLQSISNMP